MDSNKNQRLRIMRSFSIFVFFVLVTYLAFKAMAIRSSFFVWFNRSAYPNLSLFLFASMVCGILWMLIYLGFINQVEFGPFRILPKATLFRGTQIFVGFPPLLIGIISFLSLVGLLLMPPSCELPNMLFVVDTGEEVRQYTPDSTANITGVGSINIAIESEEEVRDVLCTWNAKGEKKLQIESSSTYCSTTLFFNNEPDIVIVTANVKMRNCPNYSIFNFSIDKRN